MDKKISLKKMVSKSCDGKGGAASNFASSGQISQTNKSIGTKFPSL